MKRCGALAAVLMAVAASGGGVPVAWAQEGGAAPPAAQDGSGVRIRTYNVADLVRTAPDYPFDSAIKPPTFPQTEGGGGGVTVLTSEDDKHGSKGAHAGIAIDQLREVIVRTVAPESWRPLPRASGEVMSRTVEMVGSVQTLGSLLIVTQTEENHKRVSELLDSIRAEYGPLKTVRVRMRWVLLEAGQAKEMAGGAVDLSKLPDDVVWAAGETTCFSGQTVHVASGRGRTWVYDIQPVVGTNATGYDPQSQLVQSGAVVQVTPLLSPDGQTAVLDVSSVVTDWSPMQGTANPRPTTRARNDDLATQVDRLDVGVQQVRTTVRVPVGKAVVVGGMTKEPGTDGRQMYLVAEVSSGEG